MISAFTRTPRRTYSKASGRVTGPPLVGGLTHLDQMTVGVPDVATDPILVLPRRRQELSTPGTRFGVHGHDVFDPILRKLLTRSGSAGLPG